MPRINIPREEWVVWEDEDIEYMLMMADSHEQKVLIAILYRLGCRITEALMLKRRDFRRVNGTIEVNVFTLKQKTKFTRLCLLDVELAFVDIIREYVNGLPSPEAKLFTFPRQSAWRFLKRINEKAWCHSFRHTRATKFARQGASVMQLMQWFGWSQTKMPMNYVRQSRELIEGLSKMG